MNNFHKLRENFQKFLNEGPAMIPGYPNTSYDEINNAHEELKKALLDVSRASLASAAYNFGRSPEDVDARDANDVGVMDRNWDKYLSANLDQIVRAGFPGTGIRREYRNEKFWKDTKLGGENGLLYLFHHNAGSLINHLEGQLVVAERKLKGEDLNDEETKEKFKGVMLEIEAIKKAIEEVKKFKAVLDATGGKPHSEFGQYRTTLSERLAGESGSDKKFPSDWTDDEREIELGAFIREIKDLTQTLEKWKSDNNKDFWVKDIDKKLTYASPYKVPNAIFGRLNKITYNDGLKKLLDKASISWTKSESDFGKYDDTKTNLMRLLDGLEKELKKLKAQKSLDSRKRKGNDLTIYDTWKEHNDVTLDKIINNERI